VALSPAQSAEWEKAIRVILCDCGCHPQSVEECACGRAATMRDEIAAAVAGGRDGEQVIADYVARYGEKILIAPTGEGFNLVAWLAPGFGFLAAAITLAVVLRRWRSGTTPALAGAPPAPAGDDPYALALERELETYDR
jgi:cytochrome c-type biogenesis protein CcmH